jgi:hypothetical protein
LIREKPVTAQPRAGLFADDLSELAWNWGALSVLREALWSDLAARLERRSGGQVLPQDFPLCAWHLSPRF